MYNVHTLVISEEKILVEIIQAPMDVLRTAHLKSMLRRQVRWEIAFSISCKVSNL